MGVRMNHMMGLSTNTQSEEILIRIGQVVSVDDEYDGMRIKVRLEQDTDTVLDKDLPYAFPLLPKTIQSVPKVGEAVLIILSRLGNRKSQRYYIGPLISQPQYMYNERYYSGLGTSTSLVQGNFNTQPLEPISHFAETEGAFPQKNDIALLGRKSEDIILKDGEIDLRCGIRGKKIHDDGDSESGLKGDVVFNTQSPAYLQLKYQRGLCRGNKQVADSVINIVADKINLISHKDNELSEFNLVDSSELIESSKMDDIMSKLHQVPYGDLLLDLLKRMRLAITNHVHPYPGLPAVPCEYIVNLLGFDIDTILSENVRIS